jgi:outer membrane receptor protein involved in Fe transport
MDVGYTLNPTPQNPSGLYPTSAPSGGIGAYRNGDRCNAVNYEAGIYGGCITPGDQTRAFSYDTWHGGPEQFSTEIKVRSSLEGPLNFLLGATHTRRRGRGDTYFLNNMIDLASTQPLWGVRLYPGFILTTWDEEDWAEGYAAFGELYWEPNERLKITAGLRYDWADVPASNIEFFPYTSFDINGAFGGPLGSEPRWVRFAMGTWLSGEPSAEAIALADFYGATEAIEAALRRDPLDPATFPAQIDALQLVPPIPDYGETLAINDYDLNRKWEELSGRLVIDWAITPESLAYASYTRAFKPGGISANRDQLDKEVINAFEMGVKSTLLDGTLRLNAAAFAYDYSDLQFEAAFVTEAGKNADADIRGAEAEALWRPASLPNLTLQLSYGWLDTEILDLEDIDPTNPTNGDSDWVRFKDSLIGFAGLGYIAPVEDVLPLVDVAVATGFARDIPGTVYDNGIPAYFSQLFLQANGVTTLEGLPADLDGNSLPNSPEHSVSMSLAWSWYFSPGTLTARWDYYWQAESYARYFNSGGDRIDAWDQHNASLIFESADDRWSARFWVRNIEDEEIVTGNTVEANPFGQFRRYYLTEPRIFGMSVRYNFGV